MSTTGKILSGTFWTTVCTVIGAAYSFFATPILIRYFGSANYGLVSLAVSLNVCVGLADIGMNTTNVRFFSIWIQEKNWQKVNRLFRTSLFVYGVMGLVNLLVLIIVFFYSGRLFNVSQSEIIILKHLLLVVILSSLLSWFVSCFEQLIRATENVGWLQKISMLPRLLLIVVLISTILLELSIEVYLALTLFVGFVTIPLQVNKIKKEIPHISFVPQFDKTVFREVLPYSINIFSFAIFQFFFFNLRPAIIGIQGEIESVTDFRILDGVVNVVAMLPGIFFSVLLPTSSRVVASGNQEQLEKIAYDGTKYLSVFISLIVFGMMTIGHDLLMLYVGEAFSHLTIWLYLWLFIILGNHTNFISSLMLSQPNLRPLMYNTAFSSLIGLASCWFLVPYLQVGGAVISLGLYSISQMIFYYVYFWPSLFRLDGWRIMRHCVIPSALSGLVIFIFCNNLPHTQSNLCNICVFGLIFVALYALSLKIILNKKDMQFIRELVVNKYNFRNRL